ncbi:hypothetical protein AQUCO_01500338v1 [Aquilegia coerulea]|uniref:F-box domain-containing protein n=1 Tax=Aquilegia coerulea TaxID=218851 RepID=A0A2G5DTF6_AQUCA|nr:hypothetical protein AQUCO_01500338v1 [Aquilegia coerulea]
MVLKHQSLVEGFKGNSGRFLIDHCAPLRLPYKVSSSCNRGETNGMFLKRRKQLLCFSLALCRRIHRSDPHKNLISCSLLIITIIIIIIIINFFLLLLLCNSLITTKMDNENSSSASTSGSDVIPNKRSHLQSYIKKIFCKLPVKTLCRLKCVSKDWCALIEKRDYVDKNQPKEPFKFAIHDADEIVFTCSVSRDGSTTRKAHIYKAPLEHFRYCNGLIGYFKRVDDSCALFLSNPATGEEIEVASPTQRSIRSSYYELGFDPSSNEYKILIWNQKKGSVYPPKHCYVRTLEKGTSWKPVNNIPHVLSRLEEPRDDFHRPHFSSANGTLFWFIGSESIVVSFNLADEQFGTVKIPVKIDEEKNTYFLFEFKGCLCLVEQPCFGQEKCHLENINVWKLNDIDTSNWVILIMNKKLPLEDTNLHNYFMDTEDNIDVYPAHFLSQNGEVLIGVVDNEHKYIFLYDFLGGCFARIELTGELQGFGPLGLNNYAETDLSLLDFGYI